MEVEPLTAQVSVTIDNEQLYQKIVELKNQISELETEKTELQKQLETSQEENAELESQIKNLDAQILDLQTEIQNLQNDFDTLNGEIAENKSEYALETKNLIANAINSKGGTITQQTTFRSYADEICNMKLGDLDTSLLLHFDELPLKDSSVYNYGIAISGETTLSADIKKFGNSSLYLDGSNKIYVTETNFPRFWGEEYTVEMFIYPLAVNSNVMYLYGFDNTNYFNSLLYDKYYTVHNNTYFYIDVKNPFSNGCKANQWNHIAFTKKRTTIRSFINGKLLASKEVTNGLASQFYRAYQNFVIGNATKLDTVSGFKGYIDEFRMSAVCHYTEDFTPPSEPFSV